MIKVAYTDIQSKIKINGLLSDLLPLPWKYDIRRNVNSDFSAVTMRRVAAIFFELGVKKNFLQNF